MMPQKIVVVDDDPIVGALTKELLVDVGYEVELVQDSLQAMGVIKSLKPALAVLDILMPGIDGLTLCHQLKTDPETKSLKIAIVSGKAFHADKQRAAEYGADLFIEKPYDVEKFAAQVAELVTGTAPKAEGPKEIKLGGGAKDAALVTTVWGCRSLSPVKAAEASRYGRSTSCVTVEAGGELLIFDAGSGLNKLGAELVKNAKYTRLWLFISHFHSDHVEGLGSFVCARDNRFSINLAGASDPNMTLAEKVTAVFDEAPGKLGPVTSPIELFEMREETYEILDGVQVTSFYANHPGTTLGFTLETQKRKLVYCPDSEVYGERGTALQDYDEKLGGLIKNADLLIHDGRYSPEDYKTRRDNGHSSWRSAVELAARFKVKRLVLTHHDDQYTDSALEDISSKAKRLGVELGVDVTMAAEGLKIGI
jgi:CheY-like chemotaxis protein